MFLGSKASCYCSEVATAVQGPGSGRHDVQQLTEQTMFGVGRDSAPTTSRTGRDGCAGVGRQAGSNGVRLLLLLLLLPLRELANAADP